MKPLDDIYCERSCSQSDAQIGQPPSRTLDSKPKNIGRKNHKPVKKRKHSDSEEANTISKRPHIGNSFSNALLNFRDNLQDEPDINISQNSEESNQCCMPRYLIRLMYKLDLAVLCLLRKCMFHNKYPSLSVGFKTSGISKFSDIVLYCESKYILVQIEYADKYYINNSITYNKLFMKGECFYINQYFDSFVNHVISIYSGSLNSIKYLLLFTNLKLDITKENQFNKGSCRHFYPFRFSSVDVEISKMLRDIMLASCDTKRHVFYKFSQDEKTREELSKRLQLSAVLQNKIKNKNLCFGFEEKAKNLFLNKLIFVVDQSNRENLRGLIKNAVRNSEPRNNYLTLQEKLLCDIKNTEKTHISKIIYEYKLLLLFLHDMFVHKKKFIIESKKRSYDGGYIVIHYKHKFIYIRPCNTSSDIGFNHLFPQRKNERSSMFSINKYFAVFVEELEKNIKYFIILTNGNLDLTGDNTLRKTQSKHFYPIQFCTLDYNNKKLKYFSAIDYSNVYQLARDELTREKLFCFLTLPPCLQIKKNEGKLSKESEREIKGRFLDKLIFAVKQSDKDKLDTTLRNRIEGQHSVIPYNVEDLCEITLRWFESYAFSDITEESMRKLLDDIQNNKSSYPDIRNKNISEEIKFARALVGREDTPVFEQLLEFLIEGEGLEYHSVLKRNGINLVNMSGILNRAGTNSLNAFKELYKIWFDEEGNKTHYLKTLDNGGVSLINVSSILNRSRAHAANAFKDLYDLWFDEQGDKTGYLKTLEREGINLANMSSILNSAGVKASQAFQELFDLWFDAQGNKTRYLRTIEQSGIKICNITSILNGSGSNASRAFKDLYDLWFDAEGNKTLYLKALEKEKISLVNMSSILNGVGSNACKAFKDVYSLWFDEEGNKTQYLKTLENEGISLSSVSSILSRAGMSAPKAFKDLYNLWFNTEGNITHYLKVLKQKDITMSNVSSILGGSGANAPRSFKDLYDLWFDDDGNKTRYLRTLEEEGIGLCNMSSILHGAGTNAPKAFKDLYNLWFDKKGKKTKYLVVLQERKVSLNSMSSILGGAGIKAPKAFEQLFDLWFDKDGRKTKYLKTLEKEGIQVVNMASIVHGAGGSASKAFKDLYDLWFNEEGNKSEYLKALEKEGINLINISGILNGSGSNAANAFKKLYYTFLDDRGNKTQHLKDFTENEEEHKGFALRNLSGILGGAGNNSTSAFEKLHSVCFDDEGRYTTLLNDFHDAGFRPCHLSSILCGTGVRSSSILKRFHKACFDSERKESKLLKDFLSAGFRPGDLCSMLSGSADSLATIHNFCFVGETKRYLRNFMSEDKSFTLTMSMVAEILHGAGANICGALQNFHDVCFDKEGRVSQLLTDFYNAGFEPSDLSSVLSMSGNNAAKLLKIFHDKCFSDANYLNHFLYENNIFSPKNLSKILHRVGLSIDSAVERLHYYCFDETGNKSEYLNKLIQNYSTNEIIIILYKKVERTKKKKYFAL